MANMKVVYGTIALILAVVAGVGIYLFDKQLDNQFEQIAVSSPASPQVNSSEYLACGCGCCIGVEPEDRCLYRSKGDSLRRIIEDDKKKAKAMDCPMLGCNYPVRYKYCD